MGRSLQSGSPQASSGPRPCCSRRGLLYDTGLGPALGVALPLSFKPPGVYRPLVWGGLWGIPLAFILRRLKGRHMTVGFIYFLAPVAALGLIFMPLDGMGLLGLKGGPGIMVHALIANAPYGIVTTLAIAALSGRGAPAAGAAPSASSLPSTGG